MSGLRIVFLGSDPIARPLLDWLSSAASGADVVAVFTQPDRPTGRGQKIVPNAIKQWAMERQLPVHQPERVGAEALAILREHRPDLAIVMAYGHILKDDFIAVPRLGTLNFHTSLLPAYRGASPIQTAVASGERITGVTLMRIVRQLDAGPVYDAERVPVEPTDTAIEVEAKLASACVPLLARCLPGISAGRLPPKEQDHAAATFCRRLAKEDGVIDFRVGAPELAARINGLFPWPACSVEIGGQPVKFGLAVAADGVGVPGEVLAGPSDRLRVATGAGVIEVLRLQRPGGRMLPAGDFLRGFPIAPGTILPSTPMPALVARG